MFQPFTGPLRHEDRRTRKDERLDRVREKVMLDGDEAATDTAVSQFRNSSPILMRPVYFPAILSPCYGLPLCNYILIPPAARRVSSRSASFSLRLLPSAPRAAADFQLVSSLSLSIYASSRRFSFVCAVPNVRASVDKQALRSFRNGARSLFTLSGDIVTYPRSSYPPPPRSLFAARSSPD